MGRTFLSGFKSLKINWDTLQVDIGNVSVWWSDVIKGEELDSRVMVAQDDFIASKQASQQRLMDNTLDGTKDCKALVDNIIAYGKGSFIENLEQIREVFDMLRKSQPQFES